MNKIYKKINDEWWELFWKAWVSLCILPVILIFIFVIAKVIYEK